MPPSRGPAGGPTIQDEVLANILAQPVGPYTVGAYGLPREFLAALADRITCASFQETFRAFPGVPPPSGALAPAGAAPRARLIRPPPARAALAALPEDRPPLRGFRADGSVPFRLAPGADPVLRATADLIAARLTADGLIATAAGAVRALPPDRRPGAPAILRDAGFPIDLLDHFTLEGLRGPDILRFLSGRPDGDARALASAARFEYRPALPGFRAMLEDGSEPIGALRLHITGDSYWGGAGAGSSLEVASQVARAFPGIPLYAAVHSMHADAVLRATAAWAGRDADLRLIVQDTPVSQWAQDNAKGGAAPDGSPACLLPRYASRGEDGSILLTGDTIAGENLVAAGLAVHRSGLHFQGGNLMCVHHPATGERLLLVGEAEVLRNTILGLTAREATEALRLEFGADRALTLPGASFHIDFDVTVRRHGAHSVAFINDTLAGATAVVQAALALLDGVVDARALATARGPLIDGRIGEAARALVPLCRAASANPGAFHRALSGGPADPGAANLRLFLLGIDLLVARSLGPEGGADANHREIVGALSRLEGLRDELHAALRREGFRTVGVPSLSEQRLGLNAINCVHSPDALFIPAWGGVYAPVDLQARRVFETSLPGVRIVPVSSAETQRRAGGPHCAVGLIPGSSPGNPDRPLGTAG